MKQIAKLLRSYVSLILLFLFSSACTGQGIGFDAGLILGGQGAMTNEFSGATDTDSEDEFYDEADFSESEDVAGSEFDVINMDGDVVELDSDLAVADDSGDEIVDWDGNESVDVDEDADLESIVPKAGSSATEEFEKNYDDETESEYNDETGPFSLPVNPAKEDETYDEEQNESNRECDSSEEGDLMLAMLEPSGESEDMNFRRSTRFAGRGRISTGDVLLQIRDLEYSDDVEVILVKCEKVEDEEGDRHFEWIAQKANSLQSVDVVADFDSDEIHLSPTRWGFYVLDSKFIGTIDTFTTHAIDRETRATVSKNVILSVTNRSSQRLFETVRIK